MVVSTAVPCLLFLKNGHRESKATRGTKWGSTGPRNSFSSPSRKKDEKKSTGAKAGNK